MPRKEMFPITLGEKFGYLIVQQKISDKYFSCLCQCSNIKNVRKDHLRSGKTISCGCYKAKGASNRAKNMHVANTKHGLSKSNVYSVWHGIRQRCNNPNNPAFEYYGGRGIKVCDRWNNSFDNFIADMGQPEGLTIDRIDNNGDYEPGNCQWVTRATQQSNRRVNRFIEYNGKRQTAMAWSIELGIPHQTIYGRIDLGWDIEKVLSKDHQMNTEGLKLGGIANGLRNKAKTHCPHGHEYTPENTAISATGGRSCRRCRSNRQKIRMANKRKE